MTSADSCRTVGIKDVGAVEVEWMGRLLRMGGILC